MYNDLDILRRNRWDQGQASRDGYYPAPSDQDERAMAIYETALRIDENARLTVLRNHYDAIVTKMAMHDAAGLAAEEAFYVRQYPNREPEFRYYLRDYVIRTSGHNGGEW